MFTNMHIILCQIDSYKTVKIVYPCNNLDNYDKFNLRTIIMNYCPPLHIATIKLCNIKKPCSIIYWHSIIALFENQLLNINFYSTGVYFSHILCDQVCENQPCQHKLHLVRYS